jgi:hypothetical protein
VKFYELHAKLKAIISAPEPRRARRENFWVKTSHSNPFYHRCNKRKIHQNEKWYN